MEIPCVITNVCFIIIPDYKADNQVPIPVQGWTSDKNPSFIVNIGLKGDRLIIRESGLYYVYSQLTLLEYRKPTSGSDGSHKGCIVHQIERWNVVYPDTGVEKLFRHSESRSQSRSPFNEYVSYVGGVMALRIDDQVYVTVSDPNLVQSEARSTYFGMYRL